MCWLMKKTPGDHGGRVDAAETAGFRGVGTALCTGEAAGDRCGVAGTPRSYGPAMVEVCLTVKQGLSYA